MERTDENYYIAIFYPEIMWNKIVGFTRDNRKLTNFPVIIHFSCDRGEHVGLTFINDNLSDFKSQASELKRSLGDFVSTLKPLHFPRSQEEKIFKDFPNLSIQYNTHRFPYLIPSNFNPHKSLALTNVISETIQDVFNEETVDLESRVTLLFYLAVLAISSGCKGFVKNCSGNTCFSDTGSEKSSVWIDDNNAEMLSSIFEDLTDKKFLAEPRNLWMKNWQNTVIKELPDLDFTESRSSFAPLLDLTAVQLAVPANITCELKLFISEHLPIK